MYKLGDRCDELDISFWDNFQYRFSQMIDFIDIYEVKFGCVAYDSDRLKKFQLFRINTRFHINLISMFLFYDIVTGIYLVFKLGIRILAENIKFINISIC